MPVETGADVPDWQPTLSGQRISLRPMTPADLDPLHAAASDPLIWAQHSVRDRHERTVFERYFRGAMACGGGLVAVDRGTGRIIGASRYYDWNPDDRTVVIGYTFLERAYWGTGANRELKRLMLDHAFQWVGTVWFHVSPENLPSQRALERIGARLHARQKIDVDGTPSARLVYAMQPGDFKDTRSG